MQHHSWVWTVKRKQFVEGDVQVLNRKEINAANPRYLQVTATNAVKGSLSLTNEGFRGMGIKKGLRYDFSVLYRLKSPGIKLHVELLDSRGGVIGEGVLTPEATGNDWKKISANFISSVTEPKAKFNMWFEGSGTIDLDMISLFPGDTWKNRPGGFRADMVQNACRYETGIYSFSGRVYC